MKTKGPIVALIIGALILAGASCTPKTATNKNISPAATNTPPTNSRTTGSFSTTPETSPAAATVTLTSNGPDQPTVRIEVGQRVEFRNGDTLPHWIASTPHPTHTDLPGFEKNITAGGTYSYTFTRAGTFRYYDNLDPGNTALTGQVIVE